MDMPTAATLEMFPYVDDSPLFVLEYAADVADSLPDEEVCYELGLDWHGIMAYLFAMCDAHQAAILEGKLTAAREREVYALFGRMQYRPSSLFSYDAMMSYDDYEEAREVYAHLFGEE